VSIIDLLSIHQFVRASPPQGARETNLLFSASANEDRVTHQSLRTPANLWG